MQEKEEKKNTAEVELEKETEKATDFLIQDNKRRREEEEEEQERRSLPSDVTCLLKKIVRKKGRGSSSFLSPV